MRALLALSALGLAVAASAADAGAPPPRPASLRFGDYAAVSAGDGKTAGTGERTRTLGLFRRTRLQDLVEGKPALGNFGLQAGMLYTRARFPEGAGAATSSMPPGLHMIEPLGADFQTGALFGRFNAEAGMRIALYYLVEHNASFAHVGANAFDGNDARHSYGAGINYFAAANVAVAGPVGVRVEAGRLWSGNQQAAGTRLLVSGTLRLSRKRSNP